MKTKEFEDHVKGRSKEYVDLNYCVIALNGEAGEVAEWYKKAVLRNNFAKLTDQDLLEELGDVLFYLTRLAHIKGWDLHQVMEANKVKLEDRERKVKEGRPLV